MVTPPLVELDPDRERERVRRQELRARDEQLSSPAVRRFVSQMERPSEWNGRFVSIFDLMRDGEDLVRRLKEFEASGQADSRSVVDPYVQVVEPGMRCELTGLRLLDVWRYFRHTWSNQYQTTPGRTLAFLVRDQISPFHPVIGIGALGSAVVQIRERDVWIGWESDQVLERMREEPTAETARWVVERLNRGLSETYVDDLIRDGLYWPSLWDEPTEAAVERLRTEAAVRRRDHHRFARSTDLKSKNGSTDWQARAESDLYRSKRCLYLAELLQCRMALGRSLLDRPTAHRLADALQRPEARRAVLAITRRARAEAVGTEIADLVVCGAVPPYNSLLAGKLVSMLAVSPTVIRAYKKRYGDYESEIASSMAGRPIQRESNLAFIGTTSLYGRSSSQYNRVRIPAEVLGGKSGADVVFRKLGRSRSFGTSHFSQPTVRALVELSEQQENGSRVNSIFGEGASPKLRKIREGIDRLGWPSEDLLQHRRTRLVYGVSLVHNLLPYLLGHAGSPRYLFNVDKKDDVKEIVDWWFERWLVKRIGREDVLHSIAQQSTRRPVCHAARVPVVPTASAYRES